MLHAAVEEGTELGRQAAGIMNAGGLIGDDVMIPLVAEHVAKAICRVAYCSTAFPGRPTKPTGSKRCWPTSVRNSRCDRLDVPVGGHRTNDGSGS